MDVVIIGAGNVGYTIAEALSRLHNITVVDIDERRISYVQESLDVATLHANGASPAVLQGIVGPSTRMFLAVTKSDETNLFACMAAKAISPGAQTVAQVRDSDYIFRPLAEGPLLGADHIIAPELLTADKMVQIARLENAIDYEGLEDMDLLVVTFEVKRENELILSKAITALHLPGLVSILAIYRGDEVLALDESPQLQVGDLLCVLGKREGIEQFNRLMGIAREARDFVILGGGIIGRRIAQQLEGDRASVRLLERDEERCHALSRDLSHTLVLNVDALDPRAMRQENVGAADVLLSATDSDEKNLLACLVAQQLGTRRVVSRYSCREYEDVFSMTRMHGAIGYHRVVANEVTKKMVSDEITILQMRHGGEYFFSIILNAECGLAGTPLGEIRMPEGSRIVAIVRDGEARFPLSDTPLLLGDKLLIYAYETKMARIEKLFRTAVEESMGA